MGNPDMNFASDIGKKQAILLSAAEHANEAIVVIDENHQIIFFNFAAEKVFGFSKEEVLGQDLVMVLGSHCPPDHRTAVDNYIKTRTPKVIGHEMELVATRKNGEIFPASISFSVAEVDGSLYFTGTVRDLTETRALQEQLSKAQRLAALGQAVAEITHEIKNPLTLIGGFARRLLSSSDEKRHRNQLDLIVQEVDRLETLLTELKDIYRPKGSYYKQVDINDLLTEVWTLTNQDFQKKGVQLELLLDESRPLIAGDKKKLKQVLINILKNAQEAIKGNGKIAIRAAAGAGRVEVSITDNGPGVPQDILEKIFEPFYTTKKKGTGLGLAVCKKIIEDHDGSSLKITSIAGKGALVTISMPLIYQKQ